MKKIRIDYADAKKRILAAQAFFTEGSTSREKVNAVRTALQGLDPKLDKAILECEQSFALVEGADAGVLVELSAESLPERDEKEKKRKKYLLLFIKSWNQVRTEMERVEKELAAQQSGQAGGKTFLESVFGVVKGPLGIFTVIAVAAVFTLNTVAVKVTIHNDGCEPLELPAEIPSLPGLSLPKEAIAAGTESVATLPPLSVEVDGTKPGTLGVSTLGFSQEFSLSSGVADLVVDGASLIGVKTTVELGKGKEYSFTAVCR